MLKKAFFKTIFFTITLLLLSIVVLAQQKYWMEFKMDTFNDPKIESLKDSLKNKYQQNIEFYYQSKWSPVISVMVHKDILSSVRKHDFVKNLVLQRELQALSIENTSDIEYSYALEQIQSHFVNDSLGLSGKNIKIGVIDGGFMDADFEPSLKHLIENNQIRFFKDYLMKGNRNAFYGKRITQDDHGTEVLRMIAGSDNGTSINYGMATNAEFYLARTDHGIREKRIEEDYWVAAIELFYSMGIRLVNSSLGYTDGFDKRKENHTKKEVNGKSSMITKTAQMATEKGMLIVSAAGNDGHNKWEILSLPSDAKDVLTVGAVRFDDWSKIYYSSIGPEKLNYVKPDVACFAANGTSFSAPVITGLAACIWEYDTSLSNLEIINIIKSSSHLSETPNNYIGYGVPDCKKISSFLQGKQTKSLLKKVSSKQDYIEIEISAAVESLVIFHKIDESTVIEQRTIKIEENQSVFRIEKNGKAQLSTIVAQDKLLMEVEWM